MRNGDATPTVSVARGLQRGRLSRGTRTVTSHFWRSLVPHGAVRARAGRVMVRFTIAAEGWVTESALQSSTVDNKRLTDCIVGVVRCWRFPKPIGGGENRLVTGYDDGWMRVLPTIRCAPFLGAALLALAIGCGGSGRPDGSAGSAGGVGGSAGRGGASGASGGTGGTGAGAAAGRGGASGASGGTGGTGGGGGAGAAAGRGGSGGMAGATGAAGTSGAAGSGGAGGTGGGSAGRGGRGGSGGAGGGTGGAAGTQAGVGGGGNGGRGGFGGSGGGGAGTSGSGGSAGTGGTAGTGGATSCRWGVSGACPPGQYCNASGCDSGTCATLPGETSNINPVCGCDGLTYWNVSVAGHRGVSVKSTGECSPGPTCGGIAGIQCPGNGAVCNMKLTSTALCGAADLGGTCWVLPTICPSGPAIGPATRACGAAACKSECDLIRSQQPWYDDNTCPM